MMRLELDLSSAPFRCSECGREHTNTPAWPTTTAHKSKSSLYEMALELAQALLERGNVGRAAQVIDRALEESKCTPAPICLSCASALLVKELDRKSGEPVLTVHKAPSKMDRVSPGRLTEAHHAHLNYALERDEVGT